MPGTPRDPALDGTRELLADGYRFVSNGCRRNGSDAFETRLMLQRVVCMQGEEAAKIFYGDGSRRFTRVGALPWTTLKLLTDRGSVQQLDGEAHRHRKQMFMSLMTPEAIRDLAERTAGEWHARQSAWQAMDEVVLFHELHRILCRAVCAWADVPLAEEEVEPRTREFAAMIDAAGAIGPWNWAAILMRRRTERWIAGIARKVRSGELRPAPGRALEVITAHRDLDGNPLDPEVVAVELINVLRPTIAIARFATFAALALHEHPQWRETLRAGDDAALELFVQEVRRFYPFFPVVGGRVRQAFEWRGRRFEDGSWVLFDLYGTDHDARLWPDPGTFRPERFRDWGRSAFDFVPQGAGDHHTGHRCPGEWVTIEVMKTLLRLLADSRYEVPDQDLGIDMGRMPAIPKRRFVISNVRPRT